LILSYSGAAALENIGQISTTFGRLDRIVATWIAQANFRKDVPAQLLSEGVTAFAIQSMALKYCALHQDQKMEARLLTYLEAWLIPVGSAT
jgi:hypothetical protein